MALTLTMSKTYFRIKHASANRTTTWEVTSQNTDAEILQVFRDVVAFVEAEQTPAIKAWPAVVQPPAVSGGRASLEPPVLPDRLKGSVELMGTSGVAEVPYDQTPRVERAASGHEGAEPQPGNGWAGLGGEG
jgi:hypothetical protein